MFLSAAGLPLQPSFRLLVICFSAFGASLPMVWVSLAKLLLVATGLVILLLQLAKPRQSQALAGCWTAYSILACVLAFAASLLWSDAATGLALAAFVKHSKLLVVLLLITLIRTAQEARLAMMIFLLGQGVFVATSWAMAGGLSIPWASSDWATEPRFKYVVYSTYLDQSIIFAASAAVFWHLRALWPQFRHLAALMAVLALLNTLLLLDGRTGYSVALTMITLAIMWALPKKMRLVAVLVVPVLILSAAALSSGKVSKRLSDMVSESQSYAQQGDAESSSGFRLNAWKRSVQAIWLAPVAGHGVGSWTVTIKRLEGPSAEKVFGTNDASNPHQEYLLWGVELGAAGILLLLGVMGAALRDAQCFARSIKRATLSLLAALAVACLFNSALYDALVGDYFCVALGLLMALGLRTNNEAGGLMPKANM